jgi:hypothetical protein
MASFISISSRQSASADLTCFGSTVVACRASGDVSAVCRSSLALAGAFDKADSMNSFYSNFE